MAFRQVTSSVVPAHGLWLLSKRLVADQLSIPTLTSGEPCWVIPKIYQAIRSGFPT